MAKCSGCGKFLATAGAAGCSTCPLMYHKACVSLTDGAVGRDWSCPDCKRKVKKGDNSCTPVRGTGSGVSDGGLVAGQGSTSPGYEQASSLDGLPSEHVLDFRREISEYMAEIREFRREMAEERASRAALNERVDNLELRLEALEQRPETGTSQEGVAEFQRTIADLKAELNDRDQDALLSDLDIGHLPEEKGENAVHAVCVVASRLGVALQEQDIVFAERVGAPPGESGRARRVVVRLARRQLRDDMLRAARVRRSLPAGTARIFVNERLTRHNGNLFHRVREECRKQGWRYSWTRRGRIFARKTDGQAAHSIRTEADFFRVFGLEQADQPGPQELERA